MNRNIQIKSKLNASYIEKYNRSLLGLNKCWYCTESVSSCYYHNGWFSKRHIKYGLINNKFTKSILRKNVQSKMYVKSLNIFKVIAINNSSVGLKFRYVNYNRSIEIIDFLKMKFSWYTKHYFLKFLNKSSNYRYGFKRFKRLKHYCRYLILFSFSKICLQIIEKNTFDENDCTHKIIIDMFNTRSPQLHIDIQENADQSINKMLKKLNKCFITIGKTELNLHSLKNNFYY